MLLVNVNTKQFIPSAGSNFIQPIESRDQIIYGTRVEVRFQLYNPDGTVFALNESDTFCCAGDINFIHTDDLMFYSGHEMCRIIDAAQGIVGVIIDATSDSFADKATSQNTRMYVQLKRHVAGDTLGDTVLQDIVYAQPAVMTTEGAPASSDPEYMTAAATLALFRTAPDYQFSADGETGWHDEQDIAADRFYRERRNGGEWSDAIELIEGKTGAAAGFGAPVIAVETLPAGSDATASVTASGDDTAKVFNFNFGIPKGTDGDGAGDMTKSVYDTNDDGIVDHAATADTVGATTAAQVADAVSKAHAHANKATLDKLAEADGKLTYNGAEIGGGSGTVKSVNGQLPDESGAVTLPVATVSAAGLMAAADKVKLDALKQAATYINIATDFNIYKIAGSYFLKSAAHSNGPLPASYAGSLIVVAPAEIKYVTQYFTQLYTNKTFVRTYSQDGSTWSAWSRIIVDTDITESKARPGYFKLPGGIIVQWGAVSNVTADGNTAVVFPLAFPGAMLTGYATAASGMASAAEVIASVASFNKTGIILTTKNNPGSGAEINIHWLAIGY